MLLGLITATHEKHSFTNSISAVNNWELELSVTLSEINKVS